jgi:hypothetical protein
MLLTKFLDRFPSAEGVAVLVATTVVVTACGVVFPLALQADERGHRDLYLVRRNWVLGLMVGGLMVAFLGSTFKSHKERRQLRNSSRFSSFFQRNFSSRFSHWLQLGSGCMPNYGFPATIVVFIYHFGMYAGFGFGCSLFLMVYGFIALAAAPAQLAAKNSLLLGKVGWLFLEVGDYQQGRTHFEHADRKFAEAVGSGHGKYLCARIVNQCGLIRALHLCGMPGRASAVASNALESVQDELGCCRYYADGACTKEGWMPSLWISRSVSPLGALNKSEWTLLRAMVMAADHAPAPALAPDGPRCRAESTDEQVLAVRSDAMSQGYQSISEASLAQISSGGGGEEHPLLEVSAVFTGLVERVAASADGRGSIYGGAGPALELAAELDEIGAKLKSPDGKRRRRLLYGVCSLAFLALFLWVVVQQIDLETEKTNRCTPAANISYAVGPARPSVDDNVTVGCGSKSDADDGCVAEFLGLHGTIRVDEKDAQPYRILFNASGYASCWFRESEVFC